MTRWHMFGAVPAELILGLFAQSAIGQARRLMFTASMLQGEPATVSDALLEGALQLAENGSWERIAVGRAYYLGGDKAKSQQIFNAITGAKSVEAATG